MLNILYWFKFPGKKTIKVALDHENVYSKKML
jgi:hypothetical protein